MNDTKEEVIQDLISDEIDYAKDVYYNENLLTNKTEWISIPNIYHINRRQSYFFVLLKQSGSNAVKHVSADKIINKHHKYKKYLKSIISTTTNAQYKKYLKSVLKVAQRVQYKKDQKKRKRRYIKKGKKIAYSTVFKHNMGELGKRMKSNAGIKKYGSEKFVRMSISKDLMNEFGKKHLTKIRNNKKAVKTLLGGSLKVKNDYGTFKIYNMDIDYNENTKWFKIHHGVKYKDKAGHWHYEKSLRI